MNISNEVVRKAYLILKNHVYHENLNLFLKQRVASFESNGFNESINRLTSVLETEYPQSTNEFEKWLSVINYHLLPKKIMRLEDKFDGEKTENEKPNDGLFLSNVKDSETYRVTNVNYFINAPIELHIVEVLWSLTVGVLLDGKLSKDCHGNRLNDIVKKSINKITENSSTELFKRYIDQYNNWRDEAISVATNIAKAKDDVAILSMDLKSYYYHIQPDFDLFTQIIHEEITDPDELDIALKLNNLLGLIVWQYYLTIKPSLEVTHQESFSKIGLPIGFTSSSIIANWYLLKFDTEIATNVRPIYYGRYVDDIMMVFKRPKIGARNPMEGFVQEYLQAILQKNDEENVYYINVDGNFLPVQKDKFILQYFDKENSHAGLELFKHELDERSSAFKFLPTEHVNRELDKFAYDILYEGSANKFRSIVGLAENETELAKYLSTHIVAHRLCKLDKKDLVINELSLFFRGQNALRFNRLWEKVYQYALITKKYPFIKQFFDYLNQEISKIEFFHSRFNGNPVITNALVLDLKLYNKISLSISLGLLDLFDLPKRVFSTGFPDVLIDDLTRKFITEKPKLEQILRGTPDVFDFALQFRKSNLIRHSLVAWPLSNYSEFDGDLTDENEFINFKKALDEQKLELSPRYIHFDEWQLYKIPGLLSTDQPNFDSCFEESLKKFTSKNFNKDFPVFKASTEGGVPNDVVVSNYKIGDHEEKNLLRLGIANLVVSAKDIEYALRKDKSPNIDFDRQDNLYQILNAAVKNKTDLLVLPEVSIPVSWLPFMVSFSRRNQIGLIFGLEHWVVNAHAFNLIVEVLPFKVSKRYKSCAVITRIKNHYAPAELEQIDSLRLIPGNQLIKPNAYYHKVKWRGVSFASYNCFELSDITHRTIFRSEIDLLIACVWNKDTNYYQHILESTVRDIHCYTVQSNTSQYGGSCVLRPTNTDNKVMLYVKGGENPCLLTSELDIAALRSFQFKSRPNKDDIFKHLPPGYDCDKVKDR